MTQGQTGWNGSEFKRIGSPAINENGAVVFEGLTNAASDARGVWLGIFDGVSYTVRKILQAGDTQVVDIPTAGGLRASTTVTADVPFFSSTGEGAIGFSRPLIDNGGRVAFVSSIASTAPTQGESVVWGAAPPVYSPFLLAGAPYRKPLTPGDTGVGRFYHRWFNWIPSNQDLNTTGHIAMSRGGPGEVAWYAKLEAIDPLDTGDEPPFMEAQGIDDFEGGIFTGAGPTKHTEVVRYQDPVPGLGVTYGIQPTPPSNWFGTPVMNAQGDVAFLAAASDGSSVITAYDISAGDEPADRRRRVFADGLALPETPQGFVGFVSTAPVINQDGAVAFRAFIDDLDGTVEWGIWAEDASLTLGKVIDTTDPVPNFPSATWTLFGDPVLNQNYEKAFVGKHERDVNGEAVTIYGVYHASSLDFITRVAEQGQLTPLVPNATSGLRNIGTFAAFDDPSMNDSGDIVFRADLNIGDQQLVDNLDSVPVLPQFKAEQGIFVTDEDGTLRAVVATGMTMDDLLGNGDNRVLLNLVYTADATGIDDVLFGIPLRELRNSGHQDGRRTGVTNRVPVNINGDPCQSTRVAFAATLGTPGVSDPAAIDLAVIVAELVTCDPSGCNSCLCSTDPACEFNGLLLGSGPDFDQSGTVDDMDVNLMMMAWGYTKGRFDMNQDGIVGEKDLALLMEDYGNTVETK